VDGQGIGGLTIPHWPLPAVRDLTCDRRWSTYDVSVLKPSSVSFRGCVRMGNTLKLPSPTKLAGWVIFLQLARLLPCRPGVLCTLYMSFLWVRHLLGETETTEYTECQAFFPVVRMGSPYTPSSTGECCSSPLWVQGGRHARLRGRGWGRTQFRRRDRHSGTLQSSELELPHPLTRKRP
jgi:hypothetical protein